MSVMGSGGIPQQFGDYTLGEELGRGAYGRVFVCHKAGTDERFAAKTFDLRRLQLSANLDREKKKIKREAEILRTLPPHPSLVRFDGMVQEGDQVFFLLELVIGGDLETVLLQRPKINGRPRFREREACYVFRQLVEGLGHLHCHGIIHRDLKLENVLVLQVPSKDQEEVMLDVKLTDFGLSKIVGEGCSDATSTVGSPRYVAPEVLAKGVHDFRADLWSLGILLYVLLNGSFPDAEPAKASQGKLDAATNSLPVSPQVQTVVLGLLRHQPESRMPLEILRVLPWLKPPQVKLEEKVHVKSEDGQECPESHPQTGDASVSPPLRRRPSRALWLSTNPWQLDAEKQASSPSDPASKKRARSRISEERILGEVKKWCGTYGWIRPSHPIQHTAAPKHVGDVFVHESDVVGPKLEEGTAVNFLVYIDGDGLGAEQCKPFAACDDANSVSRRALELDCNPAKPLPSSVAKPSPVKVEAPPWIAAISRPLPPMKMSRSSSHHSDTCKDESSSPCSMDAVGEPLLPCMADADARASRECKDEKIVSAHALAESSPLSAASTAGSGNIDKKQKSGDNMSDVDPLSFDEDVNARR